METDPSANAVVPHAEFKAMALLALTLVLIVAFILYVMAARGVFESKQQLVLIAEDSEGVNVGMNLTFSGFPIGRVRRIELAADGKVRILINVPTKDAHWLRSSTVFTLERGLVGDTKIRAFSGNLDDPQLEDEAVRTVHAGDVNAQIPRLVATMRGLLENLEKMSANDSSLNTSLGNMQALTDRMKGKYGALGGVLGSDEHAKKVLHAIDQGNTLLAKTDKRLYGTGGLMDETQKTVAQLDGLLRDARESLKKADAVLAEAQAIGANAKGATTDLGVLRMEVEASLRKLGHLVDEINRKWPFARDTEIKLP